MTNEQIINLCKEKDKKLLNKFFGKNKAFEEY